MSLADDASWRIEPVDPVEIAAAEALADLESQAFGAASWGRDAVISGVSAPHVRSLFARPAGGGAPVGFAMWRPLGEEAELLTIGIAPDARRRGAAEALLADVMAAAVASRARSLFLEVSAQNSPAISLYEKAGFDVVSTRRAYYRNGEDAVVMLRALDA